MKKLFTLFLVTVAALSLVACNKDEETSEFANDGVFTAFAEGNNYGTLMVTWVDVTIENGEIKEFNIDARQGSIVEDGENAGDHVWNEETKKELGYAYRMHGQRELSEEDYIQYLKDEGKLEWFEQADLIEKKWLADGVDSVTTDGEGTIDNITGVTISDGSYIELAKEAVQNAKDNKVVAFTAGLSSGKAQLTSVTITLDENGKTEGYSIDVLQSNVDSEGAHSWKDETKKELGYAYRMHGQRELSEEEYKQYLEDNNLLEWFEQAELIEAKWLADGVDSIKADEIDQVTGVTISDGGYIATAKAAAAKIK